MVASLIVKVIGAFFQIPLQNMIGGEESPAFGLFSAAYRIYTAMLIISTVGLPAALSKMVAEATAYGREREVRRIVRVAAGILCRSVCWRRWCCFSARVRLRAGSKSRCAAGGYGHRAERCDGSDFVRVPRLLSGTLQHGAHRGIAGDRGDGQAVCGSGPCVLCQQHGMDDAVVAALTVLGVTLVKSWRRAI